jgi:glycosyltransferase involved in cell wall biosynthesis
VDIPHYSFKEQILYPYLIQKQKVDLMHFPHFNAPLAYRKPSIVTIHDLILSFYPGKSIGSWFKERAYHLTLASITKRAEKIISVSAHTKKDIVELLQIDDRKIQVIYNGVDERFFEIIPEKKIQEVKTRLGLSRYILYR